MATITASAAGGAWNTNGAWVGSVQPTAADDVLFTASSGNVNIPSGITALCRSIDFTGYIGTFTFTASSSTLTIGDALGGKATFVNTMTLTLTGVGLIKFVASTASTTYALTTGGRTMPNLEVNTGSTTTIQFADNVTATGATLTLTAGKWDWNGKTVNTGQFTSSNSNARTLTLGAAVVTLTNGGTPWSCATVTSFTVTANTATVTLSGATATFSSGAVNYNGLTVVMTGSGVATVGSGAFTVAGFTRTGTAVKTDTLSITGSFTVTGTFTVNGNSATNRLLVQSSTVGTARTITCNTTATGSNVDIQDITAAGTGTWDLHAITGNSGDCGGNTGITFTASATQTATGTASFTWSTHGWTSRVPLPQDDVVINNAFVAGRTVTMDMPRSGRSFDLSGCTGAPTVSLSLASTSIYGSFTMGTTVVTSGTGNILTFAGRTSSTITSNGTTIAAWTISINCPTGTVTLVDALTLSASTVGVLQTTAGTFNDGGQNVTISGTGASYTQNSGTLSCSGAWSFGTTSGIQFMSVTGGTFNHSGSVTLTTASTNSRTFAGFNVTTMGTLTYTVAGSTGGLQIQGGNITFTTINFSDASNARTLTLPGGSTTNVTNFNVNGTAGKLMSVVSSSGSAATLAITKPTTMTYVALTSITATPSNAVYALDSTNTAGNTGIVFFFKASAANLIAASQVGQTPAVARAGNW